MNEDAEYYQQHRDDEDEWGDAVAPREKRRLASMISVRFTPAEADQVRDAARTAGGSVSDFIRRAALSAATRNTGTVVQGVFGLPIGAASSTTTSVTRSAVHANELTPIG
jgi:hypothetical protein